MTTVVRLALLSDAEGGRTTASNPLASCSLLRNYGRIRATSNDVGGLVCLPWSLIKSHRSNPRLISSCCASGAFENELMTDICANFHQVPWRALVLCGTKTDKKYNRV